MIESPTLRLVAFETRHLECTRSWVNDPATALLLDRAKPVSDGEHREWFASLSGRDDVVMFAVETVEDGRHIGNVWLWDIHWRHRRAEVRVLIGDSLHQGRGFGTRAIALMAEYAFQRLNLHKLIAYVLSINERAKRSFESAGFHVEGLLKEDRWVAGKYVDVYVLAKTCDPAATVEQALSREAVSRQTTR